MAVADAGRAARQTRNARNVAAIEAWRERHQHEAHVLDRLMDLENRLRAAAGVIERAKGLIGADAVIKLWNTSPKPAHEWLDEAVIEARAPFDMPPPPAPQEAPDGGL